MYTRVPKAERSKTGDNNVSPNLFADVVDQRPKIHIPLPCPKASRTTWKAKQTEVHRTTNMPSKPQTEDFVFDTSIACNFLALMSFSYLPSTSATNSLLRQACLEIEAFDVVVFKDCFQRQFCERLYHIVDKRIQGQIRRFSALCVLITPHSALVSANPEPGRQSATLWRHFSKLVVDVIHGVFPILARFVAIRPRCHFLRCASLNEIRNFSLNKNLVPGIPVLLDPCFSLALPAAAVVFPVLPSCICPPIDVRVAHVQPILRLPGRLSHRTGCWYNARERIDQTDQPL
ncbi:hypothetical protein BDV96DRAFT_42259 [Lophiotrema nucula]|uniref:Uncharacterized protein n=1 Tax=Lophiotrema nucula TaxID=690887 RepID=A0A6A5ZCC5_9PLEO|nr:hypothetical protein BDV96DRAFT_42259 [Lophiotrema nucula]